MDGPDTPSIEHLTREIVRRVRDGRPGLRLLVLFGSHARGDSHPLSDWDFGFLADATFDVAGLTTEIVDTLQSVLSHDPEIDLVDLERANAQLRYRAAADARVLYEAAPDAFFDFWFAAVSFWCDMGPILRPAYEDVLTRLSR